MTDQLFTAIRAGNTATVTQLLTAHPTLVEQRDARGFSPLVLATYLDQRGVVEALIAAGVDLNARDAAGNTALMGLSFKGNVPLATYLLAEGADAGAVNTAGDTARSFAIKFGHQDFVSLLDAHLA